MIYKTSLVVSLMGDTTGPVTSEFQTHTWRMSFLHRLAEMWKTVREKTFSGWNKRCHKKHIHH